MTGRRGEGERETEADRDRHRETVRRTSVKKTEKEIGIKKKIQNVR